MDKNLKVALQPKVAIVHDYLKEYGGAERVVEALHEIFPASPLYTAYVDLKGLGVHASRFRDWDIRTSWIQKLPLAGRLISPLRLFARWAFESFDLSEYNVVISSSAIYFSKAVIKKAGGLHISYIHTPPRYLYGYATSFNYKKNPLTRILGELANHFLRIWDFEVSQRPDIVVANSWNVVQRIKKFYRRGSVIIYPPVDLERFLQSQVTRRDDYYLSVGRLVRGKGIDLIVKACSKLKVPLKVIGQGPELLNLQKIAGSSVEFLGQVSDEEIPAFYTQAKAVVVASEDEDFGIVPVEAMAAGTPVIALRAGGFLETVVEGKTGEFFGEEGKQDRLDSLIKVLQDFNPQKYKREDLRKQAEKFSKARFKKEILDLVRTNLKG